MYYNVRKLAAARKRMKAQLTELGWTERECRFKPNGKFELYKEYDSPHIDDDFFWYENCLKNINHGEAYYALESYAQELAYISWRCNDKNPNVHDPIDITDAFVYSREIMLKGIDFDYYAGDIDTTAPSDEEEAIEMEESKGHINIIDWEHPERNTFEFVEGWTGAMNDGFGWDIILFVNAIPVGAILLQPDVKDSKDKPCQKALDLAQYQLDNDFQFPVYCHALVISNGKQILNGDPWMELEDFTPIKTLAEGLKPLDFLKNRIQTMEHID